MAVARHVFSYGTLLFPEVMAAVAGRVFAGVPATLSGYTRVCVRDAVYPAACERVGDSIAGRLYLDVDATALARLDRFEGELYERRGVRVALADGALADAEVYVVPAIRAARLEARAWDPERFRREHLGAYLARCRAGDVAEEHDG